MEIAQKHGLTGMKIACVTGDDLLPVIDKYMDTEVWETHEPLSKLPGEIVSANAYMGVEGILKALEQGADVVITGRVSDPAIFMAPIIHEFGWSLEDWDKLGKGTMVGHLLECACFPGFTAHPLILPLQLIFGRVAVEVMVDIPIHIEGQRSTQLSHDLKGLQILPQRFQRAHMEDRPPGFVKLSSQIAVDVNALGTAIINTGVK